MKSGACWKANAKSSTHNFQITLDAHLTINTCNIAVLISGRGSNMVAIADAIERGEIPNATLAIVISDKLEAQGIARAQERNIKTEIIERKGRTREEHDAEITAVLRQYNVNLVCLAGYMRLLGSSFINAFPNRILNIHPSLLPAFPGLNAQRQALEYGVKFTGCTVHFVDENLDSGVIIAQKVVPVLDDDTEATLSARILTAEHSLYPATLARVVCNRYEVQSRRVVWHDEL